MALARQVRPCACTCTLSLLAPSSCPRKAVMPPVVLYHTERTGSLHFDQTKDDTTPRYWRVCLNIVSPVDNDMVGWRLCVLTWWCNCVMHFRLVFASMHLVLCGTTSDNVAPGCIVAFGRSACFRRLCGGGREDPIGAAGTVLSQESPRSLVTLVSILVLWF